MYLVSFGDQVSHKEGLTVVKRAGFEANVDTLSKIVKGDLNLSKEKGFSAQNPPGNRPSVTYLM